MQHFSVFVIHEKNYADATIPYIVGSNTEEVLFELKENAGKLFTWFDYNQMKVNHGNYHLLLSALDKANIEMPVRCLFRLQIKV